MFQSVSQYQREITQIFIKTPLFILNFSDFQQPLNPHPTLVLLQLAHMVQIQIHMHSETPQTLYPMETIPSHFLVVKRVEMPKRT